MKTKTYRIESTKGTITLVAPDRGIALRAARRWQRQNQAAFAELVGPRGGTVKL